MSVGQGSTGVHAPPAGAQGAAGITYTTVDESYFEARRLKRHARVWSLWALGVGAVISGHYSGWNLGLTQRLRGDVLRHHHHRHHVSRPDLLARRDVAGPAAYGRRLFVRPHLHGTVGGLHHGHRREHRVRADAGRDRVLHRLVPVGDLRDGAGLPARLLDPVLRALRRPQHHRRRAVVQGHGGRHGGGACGARVLLRVGAVLRAVRLLALGAEHRPRRRGTADRQRRVPALRDRQHPRLAALRGVAVPRHRATAARGGGIARSADATCPRASSPAS